MPGWPVGAEIPGPKGVSGWANWILNGSAPTISVNFATSFFRYMAFGKPKPSLAPSEIDLDRDAAHGVGGKTVRTRPLCPYPQTARYKGEGGIDDAASFMCASK